MTSSVRLPAWPGARKKATTKAACRPLLVRAVVVGPWLAAATANANFDNAIFVGFYPELVVLNCNRFQKIAVRNMNRVGD